MGTHFNIYRSALVTGASSGLGLSFTEALLAEGLRVYAISRNPDSLLKHQNLIPIKADLLDPKDASLLCQKIDSGEISIDLLINNAGAGAFYDFRNFPQSIIENQLKLLLESPILLSQAAYQSMCKKSSGMIVNVSSLVTEFPLPYMALYNSCKAGLSAFTQSLMLENRNSSVKIIDLQPGDFRTYFNNVISLDPKIEQDKHLLASWKATQNMLNHGPLPSKAAKDLMRIIKANRSGRFYTGSFFQAKIASAFGKVLPFKLKMHLLKRYIKSFNKT